MTLQDHKPRPYVSRFKRVSVLGFLLIIGWVMLAGGLMMVLTGSAAGWWGIVFAAGLLVFSLTPPFRSYLAKKVDTRSYAISVFIGNVLVILLYSWMALQFLQDRYVLYNRGNTFSLVVWSAASLLSVGCLIANLIAYRHDRQHA